MWPGGPFGDESTSEWSELHRKATRGGKPGLVALPGATLAPMTNPGWYPDPGGVGTRYWDGVAWTDRVKPPSQGIPGWLLVVWFAVMAAAAFAGFFYVLLMTAFGCDSGWDGCVGVGQATWLAYTAVCAVGLVGLLIWSLLSKSAGVRIAVMFLMPAVLILALVLSTGLYFALASWLA